MPFQNVRSVQLVTQRVPSLTRDVFYWPCISGEQFPPTFLNSAGYGSFLDSPTVFANVGGVQTGPTDAQWPVLPRTGSAGRDTLTVSGRLLFDWTVPPIGQWVDELFQLGNPSANVAPEVSIEWRTDGAGIVITIHSNTYGNSTVTVAAPAQDTFYDFEIVIAPDGTITVSWDGAVVLTGPSEWTPGSVAVQPLINCQSSAQNLQSEIDITQLQAVYS